VERHHPARQRITAQQGILGDSLVGFEERNDFGLWEGEVEAVELAPALCVLHEGKELGGDVCEEAEVVNKEHDGNVDVEVVDQKKAMKLDGRSLALRHISSPNVLIKR